MYREVLAISIRCSSETYCAFLHRAGGQVAFVHFCICRGDSNLDFRGIWLTKDAYYIATTFASGGTMLVCLCCIQFSIFPNDIVSFRLQDKVIKMRSFSEQKAAEYLSNILDAISYMHKFRI